MNLNDKEISIWNRKRKQKHSLFFHTIFTIFTIILRDINLFFLLIDLRSFAFAARSRSLFDLFDFISTKSRRFLIFSLSLRLFFRRDRFFCVSFDFRHVNEIRSFVVIRSTIVRIFFIYFVNKTKSITLCLLINRNDDV